MPHHPLPTSLLHGPHLGRAARRSALVLTVQLLWLTAGAGAVFAADVPFAPRALIATYSDAIPIAAGDVDGDGDMDVLTSSTTPGEELITWWINTAGDGSAWNRNTVTNDDGTEAVSLGDLDGDGDLDFVSAAIGDMQLRWWENTMGDGTAWARRTVDGFAQPGPTFAGDLDGDGDLDILFAEGAPDERIVWWENTLGNASAWTGRTVKGGFPGADVVMADVDGDGDQDVAASRKQGQAFWWENTNGDGTSWTEHLVAGDFGSDSSIRAVDLDGDGDVDLLGAAPGADTVRWWENTEGDGDVWSEHLVADTFDGASPAEAADVDGDGDLDVVGAASNDDEVTWWENTTGDGTSWSEHVVDATYDDVSSVLATDVDGDGDADFVGAAPGTGTLDWWQNETIHRSAVYPEQLTVDGSFDNVSSLATADMDGDGDLDVLGVSDSGPASWWENTTGAGDAWTEHSFDTGMDGKTAVAAADVDGDGDLDALVAASAGAVSWWENTGDGSLSMEHTIDPDFAFLTSSVAAADLDGDGDLDALSAASGDGGVITWWENTAGDGTSWTEHAVATGFLNADEAVAADVDGDGDLDVLGAAVVADEVSWWENTAGDGTAWAKHTIATDFDVAVAVVAADVDGDGDLDAVAGANGDREVSWWENTLGDGTAWTEHVIAADWKAFGLAVADLDADGDLDVLGSATAPPSRVSWWENTAGSGVAWTEHTIELQTSLSVPVVALGDIDGDGRPDVFRGGGGLGDVVWWRNRGGQLALPTADVAPARAAEAATVAVLRIDATHRGRVGDQDVELTTLALRLEDAAATALTDAQADDLLAELAIYLDDGSGTFEPAADTLVESATSFALSAGVLTVPFADGDAGVAIAVGSPKTYFVALTFEATASAASPDEIRVTHRTLPSETGPSSTGEDADHDLPLVLEYAADVQSAVVEVNDPPVAADDAELLPEDSGTVAGNVLDGSSGGLDSDEELDPLTAVLLSGPSNGTLVGGLAANGDFTYQPAADFFGMDSFTYAAHDGFDTGNTATVTITVTPVNDAPSFSVQASVTVDQDLGPQSFPGFASAISPGPSNEAAQAVAFLVTGNTDPDLFSAGPALSSGGTLTFTSAPGAVGTATITVVLQDDGGTAGGGVDTSPPQDFVVELIDTVAPQVTWVGSPSGGMLADCGALREATSSLAVAFSEPMADPPGDTDPNDVTNPANYLLVATGPDGDFSTASCAGGAAGDDIAVVVEEVVWDGVSLRATLQVGTSAFDQELYQLLACANLSDEAGFQLDGDGTGGGGEDFEIRFRSDPGNVFDNGHFDHCGAPPAALDGWTVGLDAPSSADAGGDDSLESPLSAAADLTGLAIGGDPIQITLSQCVDIAPAADYEYAALVRQGPEGATVEATGFCFYLGGDECTGSVVGSQFVATTLTGTGGAFVGLTGDMTAPFGAHSGLCGIDLASDGEPFFEATVDRVRFVPTLIFGDGFESGSTMAWSSTTPCPRSPRHPDSTRQRPFESDLISWRQP